MKFHSREYKTVLTNVRDRGLMTLDLWDEAFFLLYYNIYEYREIKTFKRIFRNCSVVLDVGANIGQTALLASQYADRVYAFEPLPSAMHRLRENIALNNITNIFTYEVAVGSKDGRAHIQEPPESNSGLGKIGALGINVPITTLDTFVKDNYLKKIDLIKLDIEGGELEALKGAVDTLKKFKPIVILEMNAGCSGIVEFMESQGYSCYKFTRDGVELCPEPEPASENYCFLRA